MKLKKKVKRALLLILVFIIAITIGIIGYKVMSSKSEKEVEKVKILDKLDKFGYSLKENKPTKYKNMFKELKTILNEDEVDEEEYVKKISEMFVYDFYSLDDKTAKTDIGGLDFVYTDAAETFLKTAQNTYYKYVESNIYNDRKQTLPEVTDIEVGEFEKKPYAYNEKTDDEAYYVPVTWSYTNTMFSSYQKSATLIFIHDEHKLSLVELQ